MMTSSDAVNSLSEKTHPACLDHELLLKDCQIQNVRRSGPGGQHRNKVETGVVIKHLPTQILGEASEKRQQGRNRSVALFRLRINLALQHRMSEIPESASNLWQLRVYNGTIKVNSEHDDFPALLAEVMDTLAYYQFDLKQASEYLKCSASQLIKFLKKEPRAFALLNQKRNDLGLHALK